MTAVATGSPAIDADLKVHPPLVIVETFFIISSPINFEGLNKLINLGFLFDF